MKWMKELYVDEELNMSSYSIRWRVEHHNKVLGMYLITLSTVDDALLDIVPAFELKFYPKQQKDALFIIGAADDKDRAKEMTCNILQEVYNATGSYKVKEYFSNHVFIQARLSKR